LAITKAAGIRKVFYAGKEWTYSGEIEKLYLSLSEQFDSFSRVTELEDSEMAGSPD
jgi:hypothetical protein